MILIYTSPNNLGYNYLVGKTFEWEFAIHKDINYLPKKISYFANWIYDFNEKKFIKQRFANRPPPSDKELTAFLLKAVSI